MKKQLILIACLLLLGCNANKEKKEIEVEVKKEAQVDTKDDLSAKTTITFASKDGLTITADVYGEIQSASVLLCHQAGFSRGEYMDSAMRILENGISSMAIDQRSGKEANTVWNETAKLAQEKGLPTHYLDARQDIEAAIDYLYDKNGGKPIVLVGSSYSATLALLIGKQSEKVRAIVAFSPGEYFKGMSIRDSIKDLGKPTFVTSSKKESEALGDMVALMDQKIVIHYIPPTKGIHGSRALWVSTEGSEDYWNALSEFYTAFLGN